MCRFNEKFGVFSSFSQTKDKWKFEDDKLLIKQCLQHLFSTKPINWYESHPIGKNSNTNNENSSQIASIYATNWINDNKSKSIIDAFKEFIDETLLKLMDAECSLTNGENVKENVKYLTDMYGSRYLRDMGDSKLIEFIENGINKSNYSIFDNNISLFVKIKNIESLTVSIFEINTKSYYRRNKREMNSNLNLDGFNASVQWAMDNNKLGLKNSYQTNTISIDFPKKLLHKRGVYFVDLNASGLHSRAIVKIGNIKQVEKIVCWIVFFVKSSLLLKFLEISDFGCVICFVWKRLKMVMNFDCMMKRMN